MKVEPQKKSREMQTFFHMNEQTGTYPGQNHVEDFSEQDWP